MAKTNLSGSLGAAEESVFELKTGGKLSTVRLIEPVESGTKVAVWRAQRQDGGSVTVHALLPGASKRERETFVKAAQRIAAARAEQPLPGVSPIIEVIPAAAALIAELSPSGTLADLPVLDWEFTRKLGLVRRLALTLATLHKRGLFHGSLRPQNILLDDQFEPVVSEVGSIVLEDSFPGTAETRNEYWAYAAREVRQGQAPNARSDIFSLGRILQFVLSGDDPDEQDENLPKLDKLTEPPPGLVRIVRRATLRDPAQRYESVDQFLDELGRYHDAGAVGIAHPDGNEGKERRRETLPPGSIPDARESKSSVKVDSKKGEPSRPDSAKKSEPSKLAEGEKVRVAPMQFVTSATKRDSDDPVTATVAVVLGVLGIVACGVAAYLAYRTGEVRRVARIVGIIGALLGSVWLPGFSRWYVFRPIWAASCVALVLFGDPWEQVAAAGRRAQFSRGTPTQRAAAVVSLARGGRTNFREIDLTGVDFSGRALPGIDLSGSKLVGVNFERADMSNANFADADVGHADFRGARLQGAKISGSIGWRDAVCNDTTVMPDEWSCPGAKSNPRSDHDVAGSR